MSNHSSPRNSGLWVGLIVFTIGFFLMLDRLDLVLFPHWLFSWPVLLIVIGIMIGIKKRFQSVGWLVLILVGSFFLLDEVPGFEFLRHYSLPIGVMIIGFFLVFRASLFRNKNTDTRDQRYYSTTNPTQAAQTAEAAAASYEQQQKGTGDDVIDLTTVFGGIKKKIFSKAFKGGQVTTFFGGTELDFTQADIDGVVVIDMVQVFGGMKLLVPSNWEVKPELTAILGGIEDKRSAVNPSATTKKLVITGTCVFGGIDIKSY